MKGCQQVIVRISNMSCKRSGNRSYGKRSTATTNTDEELDSISHQIVELFHRASQMDAEQCVSRLICEVNADSDGAKSVME